MNVLFLSVAYAPEITGNAAVITRLATSLSRRGHRVTVIAGTPFYGLLGTPERYRGRLFARETLDGVEVLRCYAYPKAQGMLSGFLNYFSFTLTALLRALRVEKAEVIVAVSPPLTLGLLLPLLRWKTRAKTVYNVQDLWPEGYVLSGVIRNPLVIALLRWMERTVYAWSDCVLVITPQFRTALRTIGVPDAKIAVIPNFIDTQFIRPLPRENSFAQSLGLDKCFVVLYAGNMGPKHNPGLVLEAAERMSHHGDVRFLMVGSGSLKAELIRRAREKHLQNVIFHDPVPDSVLPQLLATADVAVYAAKRGIGGICFPSRLYAFLAAGRPAVVSLDPDSDAGRMIREGSCGFCTEPEQVEPFVQAIEQLYRDVDLRARLGCRGRELAEQSYSLAAVADRYQEFLAELVPPAPIRLRCP